MRKRTDYEYIKSYFSENGYKLLTAEYKNQKQKLNLICPNGHSYTVTFNNFKRGDRCNKCSGKRQRFTKSEVNQWFEDRYCKLITEEYLNQRQLLEYQCKCGKLLKNTFQRLRNFCKDPYCLDCRRNDTKEQRRIDAEELMSKIWF
ncbi:hypothetical protein EDM57_21150 [Brevibacillus gelatini]|uniref:Zinc-binding domain-containing protein n=1 Tax=Brevibacillus gelatini TaxID=1655277 RepID=A0A3M8APW4_9BACL|nr:hypothetical protein [Brevibacillus gelatini]RNB52697.1 hypothetical protein EDM57_21150 [Brevibacillus gelatini]